MIGRTLSTGDLAHVKELVTRLPDVNTGLEIWGCGHVTAAGLACCHIQYHVLQYLVSAGNVVVERKAPDPDQ